MSTNMSLNTQEIADEIVDRILSDHEGINIGNLSIQDNRLICLLEVDPSVGAQMEPVRQSVEKQLSQKFHDMQVSVILTAKRGEKSSGKIASQPARIENLTPDVKHIIAVASGKGGVGKSTVAVNIAVSMARQGMKVGLMDADIYGPSIPKMLGVSGRPDLKDEKLQPHEAFGIKLMSMGFLVDEDTPMIWRGPMIQTALRQFLQDVNWGALDILVVDMPPGTGDAQLTMAQKVPLAGAVIVSTPQDIALLDARKGIEMFRKTGVPILGVVENMSVFSCPECGHESHIFGHGGAEKEAKKMGSRFLGAIPLHIDIRMQSDAGTPMAASDHKMAAAYENIACDILEGLGIKTEALQSA